MELIEDNKINKVFNNINNFRSNANIYLNGAVTWKTYFKKLYMKFDKKNFKIIMYDKINNDKITLDFHYVSTIRINEDFRKLEIGLETEETVTIQI